MVVGAPQTGKSHWVKRLIENKNDMFFPNPPNKCIYYYARYQDLYNHIDAPDIYFQSGIPSNEEINDIIESGEHTLLVFDDLLPLISKAPYLENLVSTELRHCKGGITILIVGHNLFQKAKSRTVSLCTSYHVLFPNFRDKSQARYLAREAYAYNIDIFKEAYKEALDKRITELEFPYLVLDYKPHVENAFRLRTRIFPGEFPIIWKPLQE